MKELTTEQIQIAAANYRLARQHMTNAVEELRKFVIAMTNVKNHRFQSVRRTPRRPEPEQS